MSEINTEEFCPESCRIIEAMGGNGVVSELFEVSTGAVSHWRFGIPPARLQTIKLMRPDLFEDGAAGSK